MISRLRQRQEWKFFGVLPKAARGLAVGWWTVLLLRGLLPAAFAIAMGVLIGAVQHGHALGGPLAFAGAVFVLLQVLNPIHTAISANLGDRTAAWLYDRLTDACVKPPGMGHLEDATLTNDLTVARVRCRHDRAAAVDLDGLHRRRARADGRWSRVGRRAVRLHVVGAARARGRAGWPRTGCCARAPIWRDRNTDEVRAAQRDADYAYRIAVDPPAAKELRMFGLAGWTIDRFINRRTTLHKLQYEATKMREKSVLSSVVLVTAANVLVFWSLANAATNGGLDLGAAVIYARPLSAHR